MENMGKQVATTDTSIINKIQEMEERISVIEDRIKEIDSLVKQNVSSNIS